MRLALMGQRLGHDCHVIEQGERARRAAQVADELKVTPKCGVRTSSPLREGRWAQSGGEKSKFGLSPAQLMQVIDKLA